MSRPWSEDDMEILREMFYSHTAAEIGKRLGRTAGAVHNRGYTIGLKKSREWLAANAVKLGIGTETRFKKGQAPWNKGMKGIDVGGRSKETQFKSEQKTCTWVPVGTEVFREGYLYRKISDVGVKKIDWRAVHVLLWEDHHGPINAGDCVTFIDNDRSNIKIDNLACVSRAELCYLNKNGYSNMDPELRQSAIALAKLDVRARELTQR